MVIKAHTPAGIAEHYIVESIWKGDFPTGSVLPAERELAKSIGVTRPTLREVLQRLARDGWLTIQHGKPTKVNSFWHSAGLNSLNTLMQLDNVNLPSIITNTIDCYNNISKIIIRTAIDKNPHKAVNILYQLEALNSEYIEDNIAKQFAALEKVVNRGFIELSENPLYLLTLNGFSTVYDPIRAQFFAHDIGRSLFIQFYQTLIKAIENNDNQLISGAIDTFHQASTVYWLSINHELTELFKKD